MALRLDPRFVDDWFSPIGGNWAFWIINKKNIGQFIHANELKAAKIGQVANVAAGPALKTMTAASTTRILDLGIRGGIRAPHLHFENRIYMLNSKQWSQFSKSIIADFQVALEKTKGISFEQGVALGSITSTLTKG